MTRSRYAPAGAALAAPLLAALLALALSKSRAPGPAPDEAEPDEAEVVQLRIHAKHRVVEGLAAGGPLLHAAALFRELDRLPPPTRHPACLAPDAPLRLPSPSEGEWHCLVVITFARNSLRTDRPDRAEAVTRRLVGEFWAAGGGRGEIRLPEVTPSELHELLEAAHAEAARGRLGRPRPAR